VAHTARWCRLEDVERAEKARKAAAEQAEGAKRFDLLEVE
jgi:hypothetical protein